MDYKVVLSDFFISDLKEIVDYLTDRTNPETASRLGHELLDRALKTGRDPFIGPALDLRWLGTTGACLLDENWNFYLFDHMDSKQIMKDLVLI